MTKAVPAFVPLPGKMPACWDNEVNWAEWQRLNILAGDTPRDNYCADCLPGFKQRMIEAGRCGYPNVTFIRIIERQYDPVKRTRLQVETDALKGVRREAA